MRLRWGGHVPDVTASNPRAPHCDSTILHAPGECQYCDLYPDRQALRELWRTNYTGHHDDDLAPCPSEYFRSGETRDRWPGNRPAPAEESR